MIHYFSIPMFNLDIKKSGRWGKELSSLCLCTIQVQATLCTEQRKTEREGRKDRDKGIDFLFDSILCHSLSEPCSMIPKQINY